MLSYFERNVIIETYLKHRVVYFVHQPSEKLFSYPLQAAVQAMIDAAVMMTATLWMECTATQLVTG